MGLDSQPQDQESYTLQTEPAQCPLLGACCGVGVVVEGFFIPNISFQKCSHLQQVEKIQDAFSFFLSIHSLHLSMIDIDYPGNGK